MKTIAPLGLLLLATAGAPASAQALAAAGQDWAVRCSGDGPARVCDAVQVIVDQQTKAEVVRVAVARQVSTGRHGLQAKVPLGLRLDPGAMLKLGEKPADGIDGIVFNRCLADGCYAEKPLTAAELGRLKEARSLELVVVDLQGKPVVVKLSTQGLRAALDRLSRS